MLIFIVQYDKYGSVTIEKVFDKLEKAQKYRDDKINSFEYSIEIKEVE